ncbi:hypothetical protein LEN26_013118 [Aphanomyces euteiches]|nr:hypothetical protein AeMF1_014268 [Aphanomyces euteiches]KAH9113621.1 hypothetical protein LEN26_013118 [Aphanomyces euteiches]KAH9185376.1 hypothetical protein AeNC1_012649 [Aphanomyces euteiches]
MFVDQASRYIFGKLLKKKNETTTHFTELTAHLDNQLRDSRIANIYTDGGGEYTSQEFRAACLSRGVTQKFTNADTPEENNLAEKTNEFVFNKIRNVVYVYNHTPQELLNQLTPYEVLFGKTSRLHMLKTFGCLAFKFVPKSQRDGKLTNPATPCVFLGYATEQLGSATFDESKIRNANMFTNSHFNHARLSIPNYKLIEGVTSLEDLTTERFRTETTAEQRGNQSTKPHHEAQTRRSDRKAKRPRRFEVKQVEFQAPQSPLAPQRINAPTTMAEFRSSPEREQWQQAMDDEYNSLTQNRVWELTELPKGRKALKCKWIWKVKYLANGAVERFKARLCVKVLRLDSLRVLCAMIATQDLEAVQMDIKTAFLNGDLDEEIIMEQPEGYKQPHNKHLVCLLKKSLYGLKQSPRQWHKKLHTQLVIIGFRQCYKGQLYVDGIIIAGNDKSEIACTQKQIRDAFEATNKGELEYILGVQVVRDRQLRILKLHQRKFVHELLTRFNMDDCHTARTPQVQGVPPVDVQADDTRNVPYQSLIGALQYLISATRPDIASAVRYLSSHNHDHN